MKRTLFGLTAAALLTGTASADLFITEYMADPDDLADSDGEYFEVYNSGAPINISDLTISDDGDESIDLVGQSGVIGTGEFFVFGRSAQSYVDFNYGVIGGYFLANGQDEIVISLTAGGDELARVVWTDGDDFGDGVANELVDITLGSSTVGRDGGTDYTAATSAGIAGSTDLGSPGAAGNTVIPEPTSLALLGLGGLLVARRRR